MTALAQRIELWPVERLVPYTRNPSTHSDQQVAQIAASIVEFGFNTPVLVRGEIQLCETLYHVPPETNVKALREKLGLSQPAFAALFGFSVRSLQDWEQGRRRPEIPIRACLTVNQHDPQAVIRALRAA